MAGDKNNKLSSEIAELKEKLQEYEQLIEAIKAGDVDAFAINRNNKPDVYTLESGDYAYRILVEEFNEGALTITDDGLIVYTNSYFCELLGLPYDRVIGSSFLNLLHTRSATRFDQLLGTAKNGKSKGEIDLTTGDRIIPVYISLTTLQPYLPSVGIIITDLTRRKDSEKVLQRYQQDLEIKNDELMRTNAELASFTYVASHDLQEPLRKIQTMADLILERDGPNFTPGTQKYFDKIIATSKRMQQLIIALLDYSRVNAADSAYVVTDLNRLLEDAKENLQQRIEESGASIESGLLPVLKVIPFQIVQLFSNLLGNALKYRRPDVSPRIGISAATVAAGGPGLPGILRKGSYWEITVRDNGMGFDQNQAERMFGLFQRLAGKNDIEGTGIGLPICLKIAQNHGGHITAEGHPGAGSVFKIYIREE